MPNTLTKTPLRTGFLRSFIRWLVIGVVLLWSLAALCESAEAPSLLKQLANIFREGDLWAFTAPAL